MTARVGGLSTRMGGVALAAWYAAALIFLFAPILTALVYSFNLV